MSGNCRGEVVLNSTNSAPLIEHTSMHKAFRVLLSFALLHLIGLYSLAEPMNPCKRTASGGRTTSYSSILASPETSVGKAEKTPRPTWGKPHTPSGDGFPWKPPWGKPHTPCVRGFGSLACEVNLALRMGCGACPTGSLASVIWLFQWVLSPSVLLARISLSVSPASNK